MMKMELELAPQRRIEDPRLLTGKGRFVDDLNIEGQMYMGIVLSPFAHAKIVKIDFSKAKSSPDFVDCLTGEDLTKAGVSTVTQNPWPPQRPAKRYHLAVGRVRFAGEPVAAILVKSKYAVEDLLELVEVEYEQLPVVTTIEESKLGKELIYEDWKDNVSQEAEEKDGDTEKAIANSSHLVRISEGIKRQGAAPIEPHAVLVQYDPISDHYEVNSTVQSVHGLQNNLAKELKIPKQKFHVKVMDVGGGFGSKGGPSYPWPFLACIFAKRNGLPVKWTATRTEEFLDSAAGRDEYCDLTLACDEDGKIVALKARIDCDVGVSGTQTHMPSLTMWTMTGAYEIPNTDIEVKAYVTNKMPIGPVRGAGAPEGCYFIERAVEVMAKKIGIDPIEFRKRNIPKPKKSSAQEDYDSLLNTLLESADYSVLSKWRSKLNSDYHRTKLVGGIGISVRAEGQEDEEEESSPGSSPSWPGSSGGSSWQNSPGGQGGGGSWPGSNQAGSAGGSWQKNNEGPSPPSQEISGAISFTTETARIVVQKSGNVLVYTGSSPHGQGEETTFAQLASEELEVPLERVRVIWGDTNLIPVGIGTFGSRSGAIGGSAVVDASNKLRSKLLSKAAEALGVDVKSLRLGPGLVVLGMSSKGSIQLGVPQLCEKLGVTEISVDARFTAKEMSYSSGAHLCAVTLDAESGKVSISKYIVVEDCGRMINRNIVEGQIHGGVVHGIGGALHEELDYDSDGNLVTANFGDYMIPSSTDSPNIEVYHRTTPATGTLDGVKGVGESGTIASYAAVMNALNDAISQVQKGAEVDVAPALPEAVFKAINVKSYKIVPE